MLFCWPHNTPTKSAASEEDQEEDGASSLFVVAPLLEGDVVKGNQLINSTKDQDNMTTTTKIDSQQQQQQQQCDMTTDMSTNCSCSEGGLTSDDSLADEKQSPQPAPLQKSTVMEEIEENSDDEIWERIESEMEPTVVGLEEASSSSGNSHKELLQPHWFFLGLLFLTGMFMFLDHSGLLVSLKSSLGNSANHKGPVAQHPVDVPKNKFLFWNKNPTKRVQDLAHPEAQEISNSVASHGRPHRWLPFRKAKPSKKQQHEKKKGIKLHQKFKMKKTTLDAPTTPTTATSTTTTTIATKQTPSFNNVNVNNDATPVKNDSEKFMWMSLDDDVLIQGFYDNETTREFLQQSLFGSKEDVNVEMDVPRSNHNQSASYADNKPKTAAKSIPTAQDEETPQVSQSSMTYLMVENHDEPQVVSLDSDENDDEIVVVVLDDAADDNVAEEVVVLEDFENVEEGDIRDEAMSQEEDVVGVVEDDAAEDIPDESSSQEEDVPLPEEDIPLVTDEVVEDILDESLAQEEDVPLVTDGVVEDIHDESFSQEEDVPLPEEDVPLVADEVVEDIPYESLSHDENVAVAGDADVADTIDESLSQEEDIAVDNVVVASVDSTGDSTTHADTTASAASPTPSDDTVVNTTTSSWTDYSFISTLLEHNRWWTDAAVEYSLWKTKLLFLKMDLLKFEQDEEMEMEGDEANEKMLKPLQKVVQLAKHQYERLNQHVLKHAQHRRQELDDRQELLRQAIPLWKK